MMVPKPTLSLTIPSLRDKTVLDCRVYIPTTFYDGAASVSSSLGSSAINEDAQLGGDGLRSGLNRDTNETDNSRWNTKKRKTAIIAHPYAPLGGSFDDYIVQRTAEILLKQGFVVGLFNFRGAASSKGKTSWNAKPEASDYHSFVGFMTVFIHYLKLDSVAPNPSVPDADNYELMTIPSQLPVNRVSMLLVPPANDDCATANPESTAVDNTPDRPLMLLAGYSYGSLVATMLQPLPILLDSFQTPTHGSTASEIRLRARHLAESQNTLHAERLKRAAEAATRRQLAASRKVSPGIRVGGDEMSSDVRRTSQDSHHGRRSLRLEKLEHSEWGRRSVERVRSLRRSMDGSRFVPPSPTSASRHASRTEKGSHSSSATDDTPGGASVVVSREDASEPAPSADSATTAALPMPVLEFDKMDVAYLLISPIQGVVGSLATMFSTTSAKTLLPGLPFLSHKKETHSDITALSTSERKFVENRTLVVFGNKDSFSSADKMRRWAQKLESMQGSKFRAIEVNEGGHFWHSEEELGMLKDSIEHWVGGFEC